MKVKLTLLFMFMICGANAQNWKDLAQNDFIKMKKSLDSIKEILDPEKVKLNELAAKYSSDVQMQSDRVKELLTESGLVYTNWKNISTFYQNKLSKDEFESLNKEYPIDGNYDFLDKPQETVPEKPTTFLLYGKNELMKLDDIKDEKMKKVFENIFSEKSQSNLGKFEIPGHKQKIPVYLICKNENCDSVKNIEEKENCLKCKIVKNGNKVNGKSNNWYKDLTFEEVSIEISDGAMVDIRVVLIDEVNKLKYYFENRIPTSLLKSTRTGNDTYLECSFITSIDTENAYNHSKCNLSYKVTLKDIIQYYPNTGNNYTPDDQNFIFPIPDKEGQESNNRRIYQLSQDTSLQNTVELRTYTDFIGLFNGSANGIVQLEGKANFFINPFSLTHYNIYMLKKIEPFVHYTKIDDANRGLTLIPSSITGTDTIFKVKHSLEILQKSQLEMGFLLNAFSFKYSKEYPFKTNIYFPVRYNATSISNSKENNETLKMVGLGLGVNFEFKKFSNFGFNLSTEFTRYNPTNRSEIIINPSKFWVFSNEAELFYYPGESKNQSVFTRFKTFYNKSDDKDSFFQFQFGYRFSIGTGNIKSK
ncbi:hypothetical protein [Flavobacterium restrictum]|uniref:Outer membrane protein beta-barrel domain-containing protein n=1 Tax=Flavobacterium restrictum TaxID=2594428 RepID=A0A553E2F9_9FLAO|nr:hypothetical protein [Flavobacterium restrictum]TRX39234.1 hypothetical protein FNW21_09875 [Flavobacterium restrictum]